ncbi:ChrR family anti-sigma-E factor [Tateyamaria sp. ANG-S1]|uniref:ChrR family anti-sigma-E factor n=1 Tax=Tateyamaria sp. ANG-S1 TaxID=1577905 RepID=UPI00057F5F47|nr:ChrR family anti-sigma-E factor [Tateyamaria sp. ANG-S1]KIC50003.1 transcriptional regulator [Tateyamaria sp. ANG-S1]
MKQKITHHLPDDVLMAYAAGTLPEAFNLMVATHVSLCDECRAVVESYDALGGEVLDQTLGNDIALTPGSFAATMALIAGGAPDEIRKPQPRDAVLPQPLLDYIGGGLECVKWRPVGMGVKQAILPTSKDASARLLYIPAGTAMPDHGHHGTEMTMVLQGAFQDEDDYFARGDVEVADSDMHHTPVADIHEDCICLAVTDAPLRFEGLLPKIAQRFARI